VRRMLYNDPEVTDALIEDALKAIDLITAREGRCTETDLRESLRGGNRARVDLPRHWSLGNWKWVTLVGVLGTFGVRETRQGATTLFEKGGVR